MYGGAYTKTIWVFGSKAKPHLSPLPVTLQTFCKVNVLFTLLQQQMEAGTP